MALIVIEGLDGAGKSTQVGLLQDYFKRNNKPYTYLHFPRTDSAVYGDLIARFLRGELGNNNEVNPYLVALIYAGDRADAKAQLLTWLNEGTNIILDRYVYSNIAYQRAKLNEPAKQTELKKWILDTEFGYFGLPMPDMNIFLDVPFSFTERKLKGIRTGESRTYLNGQRDIHEEDLDFQKKVRAIYLSLEQEETFTKILCTGDEDSMLSPEVIFDKIIQKLKFKNIL